jgi:hypothetical protein
MKPTLPTIIIRHFPGIPAGNHNAESLCLSFGLQQAASVRRCASSGAAT